jgi:Na+/proline symporter
MRPFIHYGIHFGLPLIIALLFFKGTWKKAYIIMVLGMLIDLDHLLATPVFSPNRCSINFHPLHTYYAIVLYFILLIPKKTRLIGLGLVIHILADTTDCWLM